MGENGLYNVAFNDSMENVDEKPKGDNRSAKVINDNKNNVKVGIPEELDQNQRPTWGHSVEFLMSCISLSVGLGNIWRFPYICYINGGAVFLIPYLIILFIVGKPFYFLEMILGQFTSKGSMKAVEVIPLMKGIGWGQQVLSAFIATYYSGIIALTFSYVIKSFSYVLPWSTCEAFDENCISAESLGRALNTTNLTRSSADLFFNNKVLQKIDDISDGIGWLVPELVFALFISWACVFIAIVKGIKSSGKFAYLFAILPYIILILILIRVSTFDGAMDGIKYFLLPGESNWSKLLDFRVWFDATTQCFFSLNIGMGSIIMYSSYNNFDRKIYKDAAIVSMMDTFTSLLGGFTIFAVLGNLAHNVNQEVKDVVKNSMGLAFITYPEAISKIGKTLSNAGYWPQFMAIFFFFMLFTLGTGSVVGVLINLTTNLKDYLPKMKYWQLALIGTISGFLCSLLYVTHGGIHMVDLVDHFGGQFLIFALATLELIGIVWIYGLENICWDVEFMLKKKLSPFWRISWFIVMPCFLISMLFVFVKEMSEKELTYGDGKTYPTLALVFGWTLFVVGMGQILLGIGYVTSKKRLDKTKMLKYLISPNPEWAPNASLTRVEWVAFKAQKLREREEITKSLEHTWLQQKYWLIMGKYP